MACEKQIVCSLLICLIAFTNANDLRVGDSCQVERTGQPGICRLLKQCTEATNNLRLHAIRPTVCGYLGIKQIVCCPLADITTTTTMEPEPTLSVQKCKEYSQYVFKNVSFMPLINYGNANIRVNDYCGQTAVPLIVDGEPAGKREFPHSALLGYEENGLISWDCGGSLVSSRYILTAGHCLNKQVTLVRLGELVLNDESDDEAMINVPVEKMIKHPDFKRSTKYNDIGLIKLAHKVELSPDIRPICLPTADVDPTRKLIATGWGSTSFAGDRSATLLKAVLEPYNNTECREIFVDHQDIKLRKGIIETQLCAGSRTTKKDTCQGDSGGPLQIHHSNVYCTYTQVGITSFGVGCGTVNFPGVYTRVYNYVEWIESVIWAPGEDD